MSGGSIALQAALRGGYLRRTSSAVFQDAFTGQQTALKITDGSVTVDATAANRRMLDLTLPPEQAVFDPLTAPGGEITVSQTFRYLDGTTEVQNLGVFPVTSQSMGYRPDGALTLKCPDRYFHVQNNGFQLSRSSVPGNTVAQEIKRLVEGAWPNAGFPFPGWASLDMSATTKVGVLVWSDGSRTNALQGSGGLLEANSLDLYFDNNGLAVLRPIPTLTTSSLPVWAVTAGPSGTFKDGNRGSDLTAVKNVIILSSTATDVILTPVVVANTRDPSVDPLSSLGPFVATMEYSSELFRTTAQMQAAGKTLLNKQLTVQRTLDLTSVPNPCLDAYDVIDVIYPAQAGSVRPTERHIIDSVTIPLMPAGEQQITVRAARTSADDTV